ncbi:MAG TPA: CBS domain-containing protein [Stellaceae bacterium]|jgi:CBS-domain-containing membrane protein
MKAADIMTRHVITIGPDSSVADAARHMLEHRISGLPVVDGTGRVVGVISEGDLLHRAETGTERRRGTGASWWLRLVAGPAAEAGDYLKAHGRAVRDVMSQPVVSVDENATLDEVVRVLENRRIKRVPVLRDGTQLVGIVSRANLLQALASGAAAAVAEPTADDRDLQERILSALKDQPWAPRAGTTVVVKDGIVHLWGSVSSEEQQRALRAAAETVPGVKAVEDHVSVVNPVSDGAVVW